MPVQPTSAPGGRNPGLPRLLFVGAFPPPGRAVFGGMVTDCRALLRSSMPQRLILDLVDSTQVSHPPPRLGVRLLLSIKRFFRYIARLERQRPDAVLLFTAAGASVVEKGAMAWYARARGVPALMFPRGGPVLDECRRSAFTRWWVRHAFGGARQVLCQGPTWQVFAREVLRFDIVDAPLVPNWTATGELLALGAARRPHSRIVRLLFVGWVDREKGIVELLEVCRRLSASRQFELLLVGKGNMSVAAEEFVAEHRLEHFIRFAGWRAGEELHAAYAQAEIFVLPSWSEGLPNSLVEAMAAALACVVTHVGNIPDVVRDSESALLVAPRDADALERALARVIDDAELRVEMGAAAHRIARRDFSVEPAVDRIVGAVEAACRAPRRKRARTPYEAG